MLETAPKLEATISVLAIVHLVPNPKGIFTLWKGICDLLCILYIVAKLLVYESIGCVIFELFMFMLSFDLSNCIILRA